VLCAISRGLALFLGGFTLLNVAGDLRFAGADANLWWIDFWPLPLSVSRLLLAALAVVLIAWAVSPESDRARRLAVVALAGGALLAAVGNVIRYYLVLGRGTFHSMIPVPFSLLIAVALLAIVAAQFRGDYNERTPPCPNDIGWDRAMAFHLSGDLPRAVAAYRRSLVLPADPSSGRMRYEFLLGLVLALCEMGQYDRALADMNTFSVQYPDQDRVVAAVRRYVQWRSGATPPEIETSPGEQDLMNYWNLEIALADGVAPVQLLREIAVEEIRASETRPLVRSCKAEVLWRMGRTAEALPLARDAYQETLTHVGDDPVARAHLDVVAARLAVMEERYGVRSEGERVRREAAAHHWQRR
jgi:hypothetical protein